MPAALRAGAAPPPRLQLLPHPRVAVSWRQARYQRIAHLGPKLNRVVREQVPARGHACAAQCGRLGAAPVGAGRQPHTERPMGATLKSGSERRRRGAHAREATLARRLLKLRDQLAAVALPAPLTVDDDGEGEARTAVALGRRQLGACDARPRGELAQHPPTHHNRRPALLPLEQSECRRQWLSTCLPPQADGA
eukprot:2529716-Prymnesium_polylepis.2